MMWSSFASQINVQLAKEYEETQKTARWARPLKFLGTLCVVVSWIPSSSSRRVTATPIGDSWALSWSA